MKSKGILLKNTAAFLMVIALLTLLLPCINVTTQDKTANISGFDILTASAHTGYEYYKNGTIDENYVIKGSLTWGDLKTGIHYAKEQENIKQAETAVVISLLPILFCILAIILLLTAFNKTTMFIPTMLTLLAVIENILLIQGFQGFQEKILTGLEASGIQLRLQVGIYAFTIIGAIAFLILLFGWFTRSFSKPEQKDGDEGDSTRSRRNKKKAKDKKGKSGRRRRRRKKAKAKKEKRNKDTNTEEKQPEATNPLLKAKGKLTGRSGIYEGIEIDLDSAEDKSVTLGTTKDTIGEKNPEKLDGKCLVISYNSQRRLYEITSHSRHNIAIRTAEGAQHLLESGMKETVGADTRIYVGSTENKIHLV